MSALDSSLKKPNDKVGIDIDPRLALLILEDTQSRTVTTVAIVDSSRLVISAYSGVVGVHD